MSPRARKPEQQANKAQSQRGRLVRPVGDQGRLLGAVMLKAKLLVVAEVGRDREVVRAVRAGCSLRQVQEAAGLGSHHRVSEIVARFEAAEALKD